MKFSAIKIFFGAGWLLLILFLISGYVYNRFSDIPNDRNWTMVSWKNQKDMFSGLVQCSLTAAEEMERKEELKEEIFSKTIRTEEIQNGFVFFFEQDLELLKIAMEYVLKEKACCPFFKFDISILPFDQGFAIQLSGSEEAKEFIREFVLDS